MLLHGDLHPCLGGRSAADGRIHIVYTSHGRTVINHAVFDEAWVRWSRV